MIRTGKDIRKLLRTTGWSVRRLSIMLDCWPQSIYDWLNGGIISARYLDKLNEIEGEYYAQKDGQEVTQSSR